MEWRRLPAPGVEQLLGRGVYYGAGRSEAAQCGGDDVVVIGAGNSAGQAVLNLGNAGARVKMLVRGSSLRKSMSAYLVDRIERHPLIDVRFGTQVTAAHGAAQLDAVTTADADGAEQSCPLARCSSASAGSLALGGPRPRACARTTGATS